MTSGRADRSTVLGGIDVDPEGHVVRADGPVDAALGRTCAGSSLETLVPIAPFALRAGLDRAVAMTVRVGVHALVLVRARGADRVEVLRRDDGEAAVPAFEGAFRAFGDASHDLGGPITVILSAIDAMLEQPGLSADLTDLIGVARGQAYRALENIRARREGVALGVMRETTCDPRDVAAEVVRDFQAELAAAQLVARVEAGERHRARFDARAARTCFVALLLNAIHASLATRRELVVRVSEAPGDLVRIELEDGGRGMALDALTRAGELFRSGRRTGSGLGLAMVRTLVARARGALVLASELDVGTSATIYVPAVT